MLSYDVWISEIEKINLELEDIERMKEYRILEIAGPMDVDHCKRRFSEEIEYLIDRDEKIIELRYRERLLKYNREYLKNTGMVPPKQ